MQTARRRMVEMLAKKGIHDSRVLEAMNQIPRQFFMDPGLANQAYDNRPLHIGLNQTVSQPEIVAHMTQAMLLTGHEKLLEIGTGSGYQTAILAKLSDWVYSIERFHELHRQARDVLEQLRIFNLNLKVDDGSLGWLEEAPFDGIMVTAAAPIAPEPLLGQLAEGGRLLIPVGSRGSQMLLRITRHEGRFIREELMGCRFVPLVGQHGWD